LQEVLILPSPQLNSFEVKNMFKKANVLLASKLLFQRFSLLFSPAPAVKANPLPQLANRHQLRSSCSY
jgi:hypothetical protein